MDVRTLFQPRVPDNYDDDDNGGRSCGGAAGFVADWRYFFGCHDTHTLFGGFCSGP